jgi:hypothetical protein
LLGIGVGRDVAVVVVIHPASDPEGFRAYTSQGRSSGRSRIPRPAG